MIQGVTHEELKRECRTNTRDRGEKENQALQGMTDLEASGSARQRNRGTKNGIKKKKTGRFEA